MYVRNFIIISLWRRIGPSFEQPWIPFTQGCFLPSLLEIGPVILEKKILNFRNFVIIPPWKRAGPFIWTNLNPLYPSMLCAKFGCNWPSGSGEEDENVKSLRQRRQQRRRRTTDKFWSELTWVLSWAYLSLRLRWANKTQFG